MAPRAARRGALVLVVLLLGGTLFVALLVVVGVPVPQLRAGVCGTLGSVVALERVIPACGRPAQASREIGAGRAAAHRRAYREALRHYRVAAAVAPDLPGATAAAKIGRAHVLTPVT